MRDPVSYTHLDVYKRQGVRDISWRAWVTVMAPCSTASLTAWVASNKDSVAPVSYTHLLVNKHYLSNENKVFSYNRKFSFCINRNKLVPGL